MKLLKKNQLLKFLEIIQLKGLDSKGKENPTFNDCMLHFTEGKVTTFGSNASNSIFFNLQMDLDINDNTRQDIKIAIPDIKLWIKYITDLSGETLTIREGEGMVYLASDNDETYEIHATDELAITALKRLQNGPIIGYVDDNNMDIINLYEDEILPAEEWSLFDFQPQELATATDAGKNVETLTTSITLRQNSVDIKVGKLPSAGPGTKFIKKKVPGLKADSWLWGARESKEWIGVVGINPISRTLATVTTTHPTLMYKSKENNIIMYDVEAKVEEKDAILIWMVSPLAESEGSFIDASSESGGIPGDGN